MGGGGQRLGALRRGRRLRDRGESMGDGVVVVVPTRREVIEIEQQQPRDAFANRVEGGQFSGRLARQVDRPIEVGGVFGGDRGRHQQCSMILPGKRGGIIDRSPHFQRSGEVALRLGRRPRPHHLLAGCHRRGQSAGDVVGCRPVPGDLPQTLGTTRLQALSEPGVDTSPLPRCQLVMDDFAAELVTKPDLVTVGHQQGGGEQLTERRLQCIILEPGNVGQHGGDRRPSGGDDAEHVDGPVVQGSGTREDHVTQRVGQSDDAQPLGGHQLFDKERVASAATMNRLDVGAIHSRLVDGADQLSRLRPTQRRNLDPLTAAPFDLGQHRSQRMTAGQLIGAERAHQEQRVHPSRTGQRSEQCRRGRIGPVQILEHQHERTTLGEPPEHPDHQLAQLLGRNRRGAFPCHTKAGHQAGQHPSCITDDQIKCVGVQLLDERRDDLTQRGQRPTRFSELQTSSDAHPRASGLGDTGELLHQAGLAYARLTADQHHRRSAHDHSTEGLDESSELGLTAHQHRAGRAQPHEQSFSRPRAEHDSMGDTDGSAASVNTTHVDDQTSSAERPDESQKSRGRQPLGRNRGAADTGIGAGVRYVPIAALGRAVSQACSLVRGRSGKAQCGSPSTVGPRLRTMGCHGPTLFACLVDDGRGGRGVQLR